MYADHRYLHSFPTRRSSDLVGIAHALVHGGGVGVARAADVQADRVGAADLVGEAGAGLVVGRESIGPAAARLAAVRSEEHTSELQSRQYIVCRLLLEKKKLH